jgi:hypothetical protein
MKLRREYIEFISERIVDRLVKKDCINLVADAKAVQARVTQAIVNDLKVEDELDEEVRKILESYTNQMRQQHIEYHEMFQRIKHKLVKERNLIL